MKIDKTNRTAIRRIGLLCSMLAFPLLPAADEFSFAPDSALSVERLDSLRGGFVSSDGLKISLGIERAILINNELVATTILQIPDLAALTGRGAAPTLSGSPVTVVQNGPGNSVDQAVLQNFGPGGLLTIIQNSMDNQLIQGQTIINATISGAGSLGISDTISSMNLQIRNSAR